jgi:hypothetical protein
MSLGDIILRQLRLLYSLLFISMILVPYQNCGTGFESGTNAELALNTDPTPTPSPTPTPTPTSTPAPTPTPTATVTPTPSPSPPPTGAGSLSQVASQLQPGQWVVFQTQNYNDSTLNENGTIFAYAEEMKWDAQRREMQFVGSYHYQRNVHLVYSENTNSWARRNLDINIFGPNGGHCYDHLALIPGLRMLYMRPFGADGNRMRTYNLDTQIWGTTSSFSEPIQDAVGIEYFPELGRIVYADEYAIRLYNPADNTWSKVMSTPPGFGPYHNFVEYSPVHKIVIMGGGNGSRAIYKMDPSGNINRLADAPIEMAVGHSIQTHDPVSGNFLIFGEDASAWDFNPISGAWTRLPTPPFTSISGDFPTTIAAIAGPISTYGVVMIAKYAGSGSRVYLYRHK